MLVFAMVIVGGVTIANTSMQHARSQIATIRGARRSDGREATEPAEAVDDVAVMPRLYRRAPMGRRASMSGVRVHRTGRHALDLDVDLDRSGPLESQRQRKMIARMERSLEVRKHHVIAAGLQHQSATRLHVEACDSAHAHHAGVEPHLMQLGSARRRRRHGEQPIGLGALVFDAQENAAGARTGGRGACERMVDV
jgi:hypothetical protein